MKNTVRKLQSLNLAPTSGAVTIAAATEVFKGYIDNDFKEHSGRQGADTAATRVDVHELAEDSNYAGMFAAVSGPDYRQMLLSQGQVVEFCRTHQKHLQQVDATFFLFQVAGEEFVARVYVRDGLLEVHMDPFFFEDSVWYACDRHRLVVRR